jgi:hypothetical protein
MPLPAQHVHFGLKADDLVQELVIATARIRSFKRICELVGYTNIVMRLLDIACLGSFKLSRHLLNQRFPALTRLVLGEHLGSFSFE